MSGLRFDIPAYDQATADLVHTVIDRFTALRPLLGWLKPFQVTRHIGPVRNIAGPDPLDQSMHAIEAAHSTDFSTIRTTDVDAYANALREMAQSFARATSSAFIKDLDEMFDHTADANRTSHLTGETLLDWDTVLDRLEDAQGAFHENGQPIMPDLHSGTPEQRDHLRKTKSDEYQRRLWEIIEQKRKYRNAEGRTWRLS